MPESGPITTGNVGASSQLSTLNFTTTLSGDGGERADPIALSEGLGVLMGNSVIIQFGLTLLQPTLDTHIKYIDVSVQFNNGNSFRRQAAAAVGFPTSGFMPMDLVPERAPRFPGANRLVCRWPVYRLPNPNDPDGLHPFDTLGAATRNPVITMPAVGDTMSTIIRFIAVDEDVTPIFRENESVRAAISYGGYARGY